MKLELPTDYVPLEDEVYMNPRQVEYFRRKLFNWRGQIIRESQEAFEKLKEERIRESDAADQGKIESDQTMALKARDRNRKLLRKIDDALRRIENGSYGYCEETGEEIGIKRLEARPIATLCIEAQERHERREKSRRMMRRK